MVGTLHATAAGRGAAGWRAPCSTGTGSMRRDRKSWWGLRALLMALALALACNTPSVPLPPPLIGALSFAQPAPGQAILTGRPTSGHASARFYVYNHTRAVGVIFTAAPDGSFMSPPFPAMTNDTAEIYYDTPIGERSQSACVAVQFGAPLLSIGCP